MLGVHRNDLCAVFLRRLHHDLSGADQRLFVGKADALSGPNGSQRGLQSHHTHHGGDDAVGIGHGGRFQQTCLSPADPDGQIVDGICQLLGSFRSGHNSQLRTEPAALIRHPFHIGTGCQCRYPNLRAAADNIQALPADGAGAAQNTDGFDHIRSP